MKNILVCGGSKGIGAATIEKLIEKNHMVVCISRSLGNLPEKILKNPLFEHKSVDFFNKSQKNQLLNELAQIQNIWGFLIIHQDQQQVV